MKSKVPPRAPRARQDGVATLVVVMVLFFIMSLVAAYTSRNLIFEQRTSANQYRATQAFEAAEAGLEWTLAMLNGGRIDNDCRPTTDPAFNTFRDRYLSAAGADDSAVGPDGAITLRTRTTVPPTPLMPACVFDADTRAWSCRCPSDAAASLPTLTTTEAKPMFRIRFEPSDPGAARPDVVRVVSAGCTRPDANCLAANPLPPSGDAMAVVSVLVALKSGLATVPGAPVLAKGNVSIGTGTLGITNTDVAAGGITVNAGGVVTVDAGGGLNVVTLPGTPEALSRAEGDTSLSQLVDMPSLGISSADRMFHNVFGMPPETYRQQPGAVEIDCSTPCTASAVNTIALNNPGRVLWLDGDLTVDGDIGTQALPALLVVDGQVDFGGTSADEVWGLVYSRATDWNRGSGSVTVRGAIVAEGNLTGTGSQSIVYEPDTLRRLHTGRGSFVRVPGSWRDF